MQVKYIGPQRPGVIANEAAFSGYFEYNVATTVPQGWLDLGLLDSPYFVATDTEAQTYTPVPPVTKSIVRRRSDTGALEDESGNAVTVSSGGGAAVTSNTSTPTSLAAGAIHIKVDGSGNPTALYLGTTS